MNPLNIITLLGGWSAERDISIQSGTAIADALERLGHSVVRLDPPRDIKALIAAIDEAFAPNAPDLIFNALHGQWGEDGQIQALLSMLDLPYTHSSYLSSAIAMDKGIAKIILQAHGLPVPNGQVLPAHRLQKNPPMDPPFVIKPVNEGSSVGVYVVEEGMEMPDLSPYGKNPLLIEEYIAGRELTVTVLGDKALTVTELKPKQGFYDYKAKYTAGKTEHICPAELTEDVIHRCKFMAEMAATALKCKGVSRTDFRYDETGIGGIEKRLVILEVNTQPGMTELSLVPEQAKQQGMTFDDLVQWMVEDALNG